MMWASSPMTEGSSVSVPSVTSETRHFEHRPPALAQRILRVLSEIATPRDYRRKKGDGATAAQLRYQTTQPCDDSQVNSGDWAAIGAVGAAVIAVIALLMSIRSTRAAERAHPTAVPCSWHPSDSRGAPCSDHLR